MDNLLDEKQIVTGLMVLLTFFVGYKYGLKTQSAKESKEITSESSISYSDGGDYKMVLVVRMDLKMGKGKIASQCGHAAVGAYEKALRASPRLIKNWNSSGSAKIAVKVETERELMQIRGAAVANGLNICLIRDAGRTQIAPNSATVLAVGPGLVHEIDRVTKHLKLL